MSYYRSESRCATCLCLETIFFLLYLLTHFYKKRIIERTNMKMTPEIIGTEVRFIISNGSTFNVPAIISTTAATGDTARNKLPASPIGMEIATGLMPAASANGTIKGIMAKNNAIPLPLSKTISAVKATKISGKTKLKPCPWKFCMADCNASINPMDFKPVTNTEAATISATIGIAFPMPSKNFSVFFNTALLSF